MNMHELGALKPGETHLASSKGMWKPKVAAWWLTYPSEKS
jgi:hypothetical protein